MMSSAGAQPALGDLASDSSQPTAAVARRAMVVLCVTYLLLGATHLGWFLFTDFANLLDRQAAAQAALDAGGGTEEAVAAATSAVHRGLGRLAGHVAGLLIVAYFLLYQCRRARSRSQVTSAVTLMVMLLGVILLASRLLLQREIAHFAAMGIVDIVLLHLFACLVMPWTAKEATLPFGPLLLIWAVTFLLPNAMEMDLVDRVVAVIMSPVVLLPGAAIANWRRRRSREHAERVMLGERVASFGGELSRARIVHEAMFPPPLSGHVKFEYVYHPIQEIGGDYVHARCCPDTGCVTVTLLDVAGHGLPAALTVNRLFGELERIYAENGSADPAEVMTLLNRYIHLTMADHGLFATGMCLMVDPNSGGLKWVSAGHPPALVRRPDGSVSELPTTAVLLGALSPGEFAPDQHTTTLRPGEVVIAYTDGAFEARDAQGKRFGLHRLRETAGFDPPPRSWPKFVAGAVAAHHDGNAEDDVLIAALTLVSRRIPGAPGEVAEAAAERR